MTLCHYSSWAIVRVDNRKQYISILEKTHTQFDLTGFTQFIESEMRASGVAV